MRNLMLAAITATTLSLGTVGADARPLVIVEPAVAPHIVLVGGGCGFGFHRGPYGGCVGNGAVVVRRVIPFYPCHRVGAGFGWRRGCP